MYRPMLKASTKKLFHQPVILQPNSSLDYCQRSTATNYSSKQTNYSTSTSSIKPLLNYTQGQYNKTESAIREYFYYIDHHGMLFLDDAKMKNFTSCFKDKKFLQFFFKRIKRTTVSSSPTANEQLIQKHFPFTSHCGKERNYIRTDDNVTPFVFNSLVYENKSQNLEYNGSGLIHPFTPSSLYEGSNGRLYHEFTKHDVGFGLVKSCLADWMIADQRFVYNEQGVEGDYGSDKNSNPVAYINWETEEEIKLDYRLRERIEKALRTATHE